MMFCLKWRSISICILLTSDGKLEQEMDRQIVAVSAVLRALHSSIVVQGELSRNTKLSIF